VGFSGRSFRRTLRSSAGFTVAELLIVSSLIGLVSAVAVPVAGKMIRHSKGLGAYASIRQVLAAGRLQAVRRGANVVVEIDLTEGKQIRLRTFQDRADDVTSPLPADEQAAAGNFKQDTGTFATSPATDEPTLSEFVVTPGIHLWKVGGGKDDPDATLFDGYGGDATLTNRIVFLPSGGIAPPQASDCGRPTTSAGRGIYFADTLGKNYFRVTVDSNLSGKFRVDKHVAGSGYVSSGWSWN
jgi:type II secretory pathway pseudopilin PulG